MNADKLKNCPTYRQSYRRLKKIEKLSNLPAIEKKWKSVKLTGNRNLVAFLVRIASIGIGEMDMTTDAKHKFTAILTYKFLLSEPVC